MYEEPVEEMEEREDGLFKEMAATEEQQWQEDRKSSRGTGLLLLAVALAMIGLGALCSKLRYSRPRSTA